ncbi:MAG: 1-deoxy-D-xylulose-5-phosphate reductoisomerase, partial [Muribaculaceae bacterium]|nr:1-deoxy-D-xylulose-5-phosphate reductoisomerase [Muribaculaceae bacterium]
MLERSKKNIAVLGSTGSIGTQTLDIIEEFSNMYHADVLTANRNWQLLAKQARRHRPRKVVIADKAFYNDLKAELRYTDIIVEAGAEAVAEAASDREPDIVLTALVGYSGLLPTVEAVKAGKLIALANKETLVAGGEIINKLLQKSKSKIIPVDSEHSAIFQCLQGEFVKEARKILLTASGGPFRTYTRCLLYLS